MTKTHPILTAARLIEEAYNDQAPDRAAGVEAAQVAAWAVGSLLEQAFDIDPARVRFRLEARAAAHDLIDCGGGEWARGAWVGGDLEEVLAVIGR